MFALFTAIPLVGHLNPLIQQARALQQRGWRVAVASTRDMAAHVTQDVPFVDLGSLGAVADRLKADQARASRNPDLPLGTLGIVRGLIEAWPVMFDGLSTTMRGDRPDVVVADLYTAAGLCAADAAGVPVVLNNADVLGAISAAVLPPADHLPLLFSGQSRAEVSRWQPLVAPLIRRAAIWTTSLTIGRDLNRQRRTRGLPPVDIHDRLRGRTIIVDGVFGVEYERRLPAEIVMAGPMLPSPLPVLSPDVAQWLDEGPPVIYCNLGTLAVASDEQLRIMTEAVSIAGYRVWWILRDDDARRLPALPPGIRVSPWGPPPVAILSHPNVRVFVSHCGINSVYESIVAGTPIVGIPMFADQRDMAVMAADAGVAVWSDRRRLDAAALRRDIERVMADRSFRDRLSPLQEAIARAGGVTRAAEVIAAVCRG